MRAQLLTSISIVIVSGVLNLYLFLYVYYKRRIYKNISTYFLSYVLAIAIYCFGSAFSMLSSNLAELKFWTSILYLGLPFTSPLGLLFIMRYLGMEISKKFRLGLLTIPGLTTILVATNDLHHLYYRTFRINESLGAPYFHQEIGFWYLVQGILTFGCMFAALLLLIFKYKEISEQYRAQITALIFGQFIPMGTAFVYLTGLTPVGVDPVPMILWIPTVLYLWAISSSRLFSIMPIAKDVIFNSIDEAVMVLDESLRLVEINQACKVHFPQLSQLQFGMTIDQIWKEMFDSTFIVKMGTTEVTIQLSNEERIYQVRMSTLDPLRNTNGFLVMFTDITEIKRLQNMLEHQAYYDELTQIYNRRAFLQQCEIEYRQSKENAHPFSVLIMDVDHFKAVNDRYGHHIGDRLLEHIVNICKMHLTHEEVFARYGGEEFVFSSRNSTTLKAAELANTIRDYVEKTPLVTSEGEISITISLGVAAAVNTLEETVSSLLNKADKALYRAKAEGRNRVVVYIEESTGM